jgi:cytochrome c5
MRPAPAAALLAAALLLSACGASGGTSAGGAPGAANGADAAGGGAAGGSTPQGQVLVQDRCTRCHDTSRIKAAQHDKAGWEATVSRMRGKGAQLSDAEAIEVVTFLSAGGSQQL